MWRWPRRSSDQRLLALLGPAIAAVAVAVWTVFTYFDERDSGPAGPDVEAHQGVAVGGSIQGSTIIIEGGSGGAVTER